MKLKKKRAEDVEGELGRVKVTLVALSGSFSAKMDLLASNILGQ